jgi:hypothetical protein|nr:MAG TPA: hypothetical protein [Caudoviricetes sp.]
MEFLKAFLVFSLGIACFVLAVLIVVLIITIIRDGL